MLVTRVSKTFHWLGLKFNPLWPTAGLPYCLAHNSSTFLSIHSAHWRSRVGTWLARLQKARIHLQRTCTTAFDRCERVHFFSVGPSKVGVGTKVSKSRLRPHLNIPSRWTSERTARSHRPERIWCPNRIPVLLAAPRSCRCTGP